MENFKSLFIKPIVTASFGLAANIGFAAARTFTALPTMAQLGSQCLSATLQSGLGFGVCALLAAGVDALVTKIFDVIKNKCQLNYSKKAHVAFYLITKVITLTAVMGFALFIGVSPVVPLIVMSVILAKDVLGKIGDQLLFSKILRNMESANTKNLGDWIMQFSKNRGEDPLLFVDKYKIVIEKKKMFYLSDYINVWATPSNSRWKVN